MTDSPNTPSSAAEARLANVLGATALALADQMREATEAAAAQTGAGPAALVELEGLLAGRTVDDLRRSVDITPSGGVRLVDRLVAEGLVERRAGSDARSLSLRLTGRGRRVAQRVRRARASSLEEAMADLTATDRADLARILDKMVTRIVRDRLADRAAGHTPKGGFLCRLCDPDACGRPAGTCPAERVTSALR